MDTESRTYADSTAFKLLALALVGVLLGILLEAGLDTFGF